MPIRRVNSTGRRTISRSNVHIHVSNVAGRPPEFEATVNLDGYKLPEDAQVFIEASQLSTFMRFPFGTVGNPGTKQEGKLVLSEFSSDQLPAFRVRVVSAGNSSGLLLAETGSLAADPDDKNPSSAVSLLRVQPDDLGDEVWRVSFDVVGPILQMNQKLNDWKGLATDAQFRSFVYPQVFRAVLIHLLFVDEYDFGEDDSAWQARWSSFAKSMTGTPPPELEERDDVLDWINNTVELFCKQHAFLNHLGDLVVGGASE